MALQQMMAEPDRLAQVGRKELLTQAKRGDVVVIDVRPQDRLRHRAPAVCALDAFDGTDRSAGRAAAPAQDRRLLPRSFLPDVRQAVALLKKRGFRAHLKTTDGVSEWQACRPAGNL